VPRGKLPTANVRWTSQEVDRLIAAGYALDERKESRSDGYGLAIEPLLRTGARIGEGLGSRFGDYDHAEGVWEINVTLGRTGRSALPKPRRRRASAVARRAVAQGRRAQAPARCRRRRLRLRNEEG
jgi:hypothetical protein